MNETKINTPKADTKTAPGSSLTAIFICTALCVLCNCIGALSSNIYDDFMTVLGLQLLFSAFSSAFYSFCIITRPSAILIIAPVISPVIVYFISKNILLTFFSFLFVAPAIAVAFSITKKLTRTQAIVRASAFSTVYMIMSVLLSLLIENGNISISFFNEFIEKAAEAFADNFSRLYELTEGKPLEQSIITQLIENSIFVFKSMWLGLLIVVSNVVAFISAWAAKLLLNKYSKMNYFSEDDPKWNFTLSKATALVIIIANLSQFFVDTSQLNVMFVINTVTLPIMTGLAFVGFLKINSMLKEKPSIRIITWFAMLLFLFFQGVLFFGILNLFGIFTVLTTPKKVVSPSAPEQKEK